MRKSLQIGLAVSAVLLLSALASQTGFSQDQDREYFPLSGHTVEGAFLDFYHAGGNPELIYGYPITEAFIDHAGVRVQYFQRARFEMNVTRGVILTPLGRALYQPGNPPAGLSLSAGACRKFETGFPVCTSFLKFFDDRGGAAQFGNPISPVEIDGARYVQYFEYARFEWYPESENPQLEVQLGHLGRVFFEREGEDPARLLAVQLPGIIELTQLRAYVFAENAVVQGAGSQAVFVIYQDQNFAPVAEVRFILSVSYPSGGTMTLEGITNPAGFARVAIPVGGIDSGIGLVLVEAAASFQSFEAGSITSFRISP